jgi:hypothetical protein
MNESKYDIMYHNDMERYWIGRKVGSFWQQVGNYYVSEKVALKKLAKLRLEEKSE